MGDAARKFTNVFVKNFGEEIDDEKLKVGCHALIAFIRHTLII